ncbi:MAG: phosphoribosylglycinamide formyltransferase, partial [Pseudomonas sp.]|nr:phosphoribosylglycinamide formyltransferase [Pseudomonas sp.]
HEQEHVIYPLAVRWFAAGRLQLTAHGAMLDEQLLPSTGHLIRT